MAHQGDTKPITRSKKKTEIDNQESNFQFPRADIPQDLNHSELDLQGAASLLAQQSASALHSSQGISKKSTEKETQDHQINLPRMRGVSPAMELSYSNYQAILQIQSQLAAYSLQNSTDLKIKSTELLAHIPVCDGSESEKLLDFITEVDIVTELNMVDLKQLLNYLTLKTQGRLRNWWIAEMPKHSTWSSLKTNILNCFIPKPFYEQLVIKFIRRKQRADETLHVFINSINRKVKALNYGVTDSELTYTIWSNVNSQTFKYLHVIPIPNSIEELTRAADTVQILQFHGEQHPKSEEESPKRKFCSFHKTNTHNTNECRANLPSQQSSTTLERKFCSFHKSNTHNTNECRSTHPKN